MKYLVRSLVVCCGIAISMLASTFVSNAQGLLNNGATIVVSNTSTVYIDGTTGNYTSQSGGLITNSSSGATITLAGNWLNNSSNTGFSNDGATVNLAGSGAQAIGGTNASVFYNLTCQNGNTKTVNTALSVSNYVNVGSSTTLNSNGYLKLLATSTTNANVKPLLSGASVTGNVIVQSYFTGGSASYRSNRTISSPVNDNALSSNKSLQQLKTYMIITGPGGAANGFDPGGVSAPYSVTLTRYYEPATYTQQQYIAATNIYETLEPGKGIFMYFRGDRSSYTSGTATTSKKVNAPYLVPENVTMQYTGPINQGNITVPLSYTANAGSGDIAYNGFNLLGNPYPATIDWTLVDKTNTLNQISVVKPTGGYATYSNGISTNGTNVNYIQPGQAFWARASSTGASVMFKESSKEVTVAPGRFLSSPKERLFAAVKGAVPSISNAPSLTSGGISWNLLRFDLQDGVNKEETVAVFNPGSSDAAGNEDATFFGGSTISLSTLSSDSKDLVINFMPDISQVTELKLDINATATSNVKLTFTDFSAVGNYSVLLKDSYLNTLVDVKANPVYDFTINKTVAGTYGTERLKLLFQPPTTLPVVLASFTAKKVTAGAELSWKTASEQNSSHFDLERSVDGKTFSSIATVKAAGNSSNPLNYSFIDKNPLKGVSYYRLRQVDMNGKIADFSPVSLNYDLQAEEIAFTIFPNPVTDGFEMKFASGKAIPGGLIVNVYDLGGHKVGSRSFSKGQELKYNISTMPKSVYLVEAIDAQTKEVIGKSKIIKE